MKSWTVVAALSLAYFGSLGWLWLRLDRTRVVLAARLDDQSEEIAELRTQLRAAQRLGTIMQAAADFQATLNGGGMPMAHGGPLSAGAPAAASPMPTAASASADALGKFLTTAKITPTQWRAVQDDNDAAKADIVSAARQLVDASADDAQRKLDEIDATRVASQRKVLDAAQMRAYEEFRASAGLYAQVVCGGGSVKRVLPLY